MTTVPYLRGLVDCLSEETVDTTAQRVNLYQYSVIYKFINDTCSDFTVKVADNFGAGGSGHGDHTSANPAGENAWCVWRYPYQYSEYRTVDLYVLIQWADTDTFGASPGDPGEITGVANDGVGIQLAWMLDGSSPWQGTTDADGTDTKGTPVWHPDAMVLPHQNNKYGEFSTNREYCGIFIDAGSTTMHDDAHYGMVGNPDFFVWYNHHVNNAPRYRAKIWSCVDVLTPLSGTVSASCPIVMSWCGGLSISSTSTADWSAGAAFVADSTTAIGSATGNNTQSSTSTTAIINEGGSFTCVPGVNTTSCFKFTTYALYNQDLLGPNPNNSDAYDIYPICCYNSNEGSGVLGSLPYTHCVSSHMGVHTIPTGSIYTAPVVMCSVGTHVANRGNFIIPWIGDAPGYNLSRAGRSFT